ncbi:MAG: lipopolysaccharide heptosyltransferase II [Myxococcota bacterium]
MPRERSAPHRILVRLPNWVGDALMATPALRALRRAHPQAEISVTAGAPFASLFAGLGSVDRWLPKEGRGARALWRHSRVLAAHEFDWAVLLPDSVHVALAPWLARVPVRAGYARDALRRALLTIALAPPRLDGAQLPISMVERYLRVTRALGCADAGPELDLPVDAGAAERIAKRLARVGVGDTEPLVVVTPGASFGASKLWPPEHFAAACTGLRETRGLRAVLAPGPGEEAVAHAIAARAGAPALVLDAPVTTLAELAALIARAKLVLTNDTGPRHMAVALGTPVISLLGPTDPRHTAHLLERQRVLREPVECSPCHLKVCPIDHRCMQRLSPARVLEAAAELLA